MDRLVYDVAMRQVFIYAKSITYPKVTTWCWK